MTVKEFRVHLALGTLTYTAKHSIALDDSTSRSMLKVLIDHEETLGFNIQITQAVLAHGNIARNILRKFSTHRYVWFRCEVARNLRTPRDVLKKLSKDESTNVRNAVAINCNTPYSTKMLLCKDPYWMVSVNVKSMIKTGKPADFGVKLK